MGYRAIHREIHRDTEDQSTHHRHRAQSTALRRPPLHGNTYRSAKLPVEIFAGDNGDERTAVYGGTRAVKGDGDCRMAKYCVPGLRPDLL